MGLVLRCNPKLGYPAEEKEEGKNDKTKTQTIHKLRPTFLAAYVDPYPASFLPRTLLSAKARALARAWARAASPWASASDFSASAPGSPGSLAPAVPGGKQRVRRVPPPLLVAKKPKTATAFCWQSQGWLRGFSPKRVIVSMRPGPMSSRDGRSHQDCFKDPIEWGFGSGQTGDQCSSCLDPEHSHENCVAPTLWGISLWVV